MKKRMKSLDVLRGLTIAGMILVNTPGSWKHIYGPLSHAQWNGLTPTDLVFPFFMFMMGVSMYISLRKSQFQLQWDLMYKILKRTFLIFIIGTALYAFGGFMYTLTMAYHHENLTESPLQMAIGSFNRIRILGVLQRLAICYGVGSLLVCLLRHKFIPYFIGLLLVGYYLLLATCNGFVYGHENILSVVDLKVLGLNHIYNDHGIDPEGVLSTIPSIAHVLIGFCIGKVCIEVKESAEKMNRLFLYGFLMMVVGFLFMDLCPLNKKIWSPTFVLVTCGLASSLLASLYWFIDVKSSTLSKQFATPFEVFGVNSLFSYVLSQFLCVVFDSIPWNTISIHNSIYGALSASFGDNAFASMIYALLFVALVWAMSYVLYRKKIYIKL